MKITTSLLTILAVAIAGVAAYFSIHGLALLFSGAVVAVIVMASALEVGKLALTSVVFNYWRRFNPILTVYCILAIVGLMIITSWGIYGFLSAAYQQSQIPLKEVSIRQQYLTRQLDLLDNEFTRSAARITQMDSIIDSINADYITKRLQEKQQQAPERDQLRVRINELELQKLDYAKQQAQLENEVLLVESHIGPIITIAQQLDIPKDKAVHYLILLFIFVFDPLAVGLTIAVNAIIKINKQDAVPPNIIPPSTHADNECDVAPHTFQPTASPTPDTMPYVVDIGSHVDESTVTDPIELYQQHNTTSELDEVEGVVGESITFTPPHDNSEYQSELSNQLADMKKIFSHQQAKNAIIRNTTKSL